MIAAVMLMMDEKQWEYMTMGNTRDVRDVFKTAMGKEVDDTLDEGISARDMFTVFSYVADENYRRGIRLAFEWKRVRPEGRFRVGRLDEFLVNREGKYVLLGRTKRKNAVHYALIKRLKKTRIEDQLSVFAETSSDKVDKSNMDHAMGLHVEKDKITCYNNGYKSGMLPYSVLNVATQMESIIEGYSVDLYEIEE